MSENIIIKDLLIERVNASYIRIYAEESVKQDIYETYRFKKIGYEKNKYSRWDGVVRMFNRKTNLLPAGLLFDLIALCKKRKYSYDLDKEFANDIHKADSSQMSTWINSLNLTSGGSDIYPYDYQADGLFNSIKYSRQLFLAATSAGKSLLQYLMIRYQLDHYDGIDKQILLIVPSVFLVQQMYGDFKDYSTKNGWNVDQDVHLIYEGQPKFTDKPVVISTWQSLNNILKENEEYFKRFKMVIVDEVHGAEADAMTNILNACIYAYRRYGLTGSLRNDVVSEMQCVSLVGPIKRLVTAKELIDAGQATPLNINFMLLEYPESDRINVSNMGNYQKEKEFLMAHDFRNKVIKSLIKTLPRVTLVLFDRIEAHLNNIVNELNAEETGSKRFYIIHGKVDLEDRLDIKNAIENGDDIVLFASVGTMSTGVSIKNLHNLIFAKCGGKSIVEILQSIGRMLRLNKNKNMANVFDIVDDLTRGDYKNHMYKHGLIRYQYYKNEQHPIKVKKIKVI